jgi:glutaredoxin
MSEVATKVILYTVPNCGTCDHARDGLRAQGVDFEERDIMVKQEWFDEVLKYAVSVPVILRGDKVQVGWGRSMGCYIV